MKFKHIFPKEQTKRVNNPPIGSFLYNEYLAKIMNNTLLGTVMTDQELLEFIDTKRRHIR